MSGFLSAVSLSGLAIAVFALILVMSVMNGFEKELQTRMLSLLPHAHIALPANEAKNWEQLSVKLANDPRIRDVAPYVESPVMLHANRRLAGVSLTGIDTEREAKQSRIAQAMVAGQLADLSQQPYSIVMGNILARQLGLALGDGVNVVIPRVVTTPLGPITRSRRFTLVGVFQVGAELDQNYALVSIGSAAKLLGRSQAVDGLKVNTANQYKVESLITAVLNDLLEEEMLAAMPHWLSWKQQHQSLYRAIVMEKVTIFVLLLSVVAVASFSVVAIILMTVVDKQSDIAVLRTMGANAAQIQKLFLTQGFVIGGFGTAIGAVLGVLIAPQVGNILTLIEALSGWQLFDPDVYFVPYLPSVLRLGDVVSVVTIAMLISMLVSVFPARRAAAIDPAVALATKN